MIILLIWIAICIYGYIEYRWYKKEVNKELWKYNILAGIVKYPRNNMICKTDDAGAIKKNHLLLVDEKYIDILSIWWNYYLYMGMPSNKDIIKILFI